MTDRCPYCGERVPSYSLNCPRCFRPIPREEDKKKGNTAWEGVPDSRAPAVQTYNKYIVMFLAFIPSLFGLMGLAQMYQRHFEKGFKFLAVGLVLFIIIVACSYAIFNGGFVAFLSVGFLFIAGVAFVVTYVIQAFDAYARTIFNLR